MLLNLYVTILTIVFSFQVSIISTRKIMRLSREKLLHSHESKEKLFVDHPSRIEHEEYSFRYTWLPHSQHLLNYTAASRVVIRDPSVDRWRGTFVPSPLSTLGNFAARSNPWWGTKAVWIVKGRKLWILFRCRLSFPGEMTNSWKTSNENWICFRSVFLSMCIDGDLMENKWLFLYEKE